MKKYLLSALVAGFSFVAHADDYPAECQTTIDLTFEAAEVMPEMKEQLGMSKEEMTKVSVEAWAAMSDDEKKASIAGCKAANEQMKSVIEAAKAAKK
ncbi:MAG: hypothetical protein Q4B71_02915 [Cardiobacteriaceae bacterium]|nr:hypothetical protein [Cardiobacteriaceae bacterium]